MRLLDVEAVHAAYGPSEVLFGLSLGVDSGEVVTLLGRNGMGKTTTLSAIMGIIRAEGGTIRLDGAPIQQLPSYRIARLGLGLVPEGRQIFPNLTVRENLVATAVQRMAARGRWTLDSVLTLFPGLRERQGQLGGLLSGGEQQMLAVGRALMLRPRLMLLDEPSFGLAPLIVEELFAILGQLNRETGMAMLIVEQNATLALELAEHAYLLETGRVVMDGPAAEIGADEGVRRAYLGY